MNIEKLVDKILNRKPKPEVDIKALEEKALAPKAHEPSYIIVRKAFDKIPWKYHKRKFTSEYESLKYYNSIMAKFELCQNIELDESSSYCNSDYNYIVEFRWRNVI